MPVVTLDDLKRKKTPRPERPIHEHDEFNADEGGREVRYTVANGSGRSWPIWQAKRAKLEEEETDYVPSDHDESGDEAADEKLKDQDDLVIASVVGTKEYIDEPQFPAEDKSKKLTQGEKDLEKVTKQLQERERLAHRKEKGPDSDSISPLDYADADLEVTDNVGEYLDEKGNLHFTEIDPGNAPPKDGELLAAVRQNKAFDGNTRAFTTRMARICTKWVSGIRIDLVHC